MTARTPETSLAEFVRQCWPEVLDGKHRWYLDAICDHLQAIAEGRAVRPLFNLPRCALNKPNRKHRTHGIGGLRVTARIDDDQ